MGNDLYVFGMITFVFVIVGAFLPFVNSDLAPVESGADVVGYQEGLAQSADDFGTIGFFDVIGSVALMFFWTFGSLPFVLEVVIFVPLRIILAVIFVRWVRGVG